MYDDCVQRKRTRRRSDAHANQRALLGRALHARARAQEVARRGAPGSGVARDRDMLEVGHSPWDVPLLCPARAREPELGGEPRRGACRECVLDVEADDGGVEARREVGCACKVCAPLREVGH